MTLAEEQALVEKIARAMAWGDGRDPDAKPDHKAEYLRSDETCVWHMYRLEARHHLAAHRALTEK